MLAWEGREGRTEKRHGASSSEHARMAHPVSLSPPTLLSSSLPHSTALPNLTAPSPPVLHTLSSDPLLVRSSPASCADFSVFRPQKKSTLALLGIANPA